MIRHSMELKGSTKLRGTEEFLSETWAIQAKRPAFLVAAFGTVGAMKQRVSAGMISRGLTNTGLGAQLASPVLVQRDFRWADNAARAGAGTRPIHTRNLT